MPDVFLSYSREDQPTARRFAEALTREGFTVWWDQALDAGESFDKVTEQALKDAKAVVVLWSKHSVDSRWVRSEATLADRYGTLVPVTIEPCDRPIMFELTHTADLSSWNGDVTAASWRGFIEGLRRSVGRDLTHAPVAPTSLPTSGTPQTAPRVSRRWMTLGITVVALLIAGGVAWHFLGRTAPATATAAASSPTPSAAKTSIAVLPFDDLSSEKDQQYFADGVAEEILNQLASIDARQLRVIARNSSFAFRGGNQNLTKVGETLGVEHLLEGSVRKAGDELRITAQLINTRTDAHLWSHTYNRPLTDVFAVQEEIARSVAEALQISLGVGIGGRPGMTRNVGAYETYLQAGAIARLNRRVDSDTFRSPIELLQRAVAEDPSFALAWIALSDLYSASGVYGPGTSRQDWQQRSDAALQEAQRLQPDLPEVSAALASRSMGAGLWKEAMAHLQEFQVASSKYGTPENLKGSLLIQVGRIREALPLLEAYKARDPLDTGTSTQLIQAYAASGNLSAAYSELSHIYPANAGSSTAAGRLAAMRLALDNRDWALLMRALDDGIVAEKAQRLSNYARLKAKLGTPAEAIAYLRPMITPERGIQGLVVSRMFLAYFGDDDNALAAFKLTTQRHGIGLYAFGDIWSPVYRDMRKLPAFKQLVRDTGLVDYWKQYGWGDLCKPTTGDDFECH